MAPDMFVLQKFVKNGYRFSHFPFEFIYTKPNGQNELKIYAEEFDIQLRI